MRPLLRIGLCLSLVLNSAGIYAVAQPAEPQGELPSIYKPRKPRRLTDADAPNLTAKLSPESAENIRVLEADLAAVCPGAWKKDPCQSGVYLIKELKESCAAWNEDCTVAGKVFGYELDIAGKVLACASSECRRPGLYEIAGFQHKISRALLDLFHDSKPDTIWIWSFSNAMEVTFTEVLLKAVDADIGEIDTEIKRLETWTDILKKTAKRSEKDAARVQGLAEDGEKIFERFQELSHGIDHTVSASKKEQQPALRQRRRSANRLAMRLAKQRDYLILLQKRTGQPESEKLDLHGVYDPSVDTEEDKQGPKFEHGAVKADLSGFQGAFDSRRPGSMPGSAGGMPAAGGAGGTGTQDPADHPLINAKPKKTLLDIPGKVAKLARPAGKDVAPPPIEEKGPGGFLDNLSRLAGRQGDRKAADAMRRAGLSRTVGNPGQYAPLVHPQEGDTCALVTQQQVLAAYGLIDQKDPKAAELKLRDEATKKGYFFSGTAPQYAGSLLVDHGLIIAKREEKKTEDLDKVIKEGRPAIVSIDARYFWGMEEVNRPLGHSILITGAEVNKLTGSVLGYYYNDSGDDPPKGGGFITAEKFKKSFESRGGNFIEIQ